MVLVMMMALVMMMVLVMMVVVMAILMVLMLALVLVMVVVMVVFFHRTCNGRKSSQKQRAWRQEAGPAHIPLGMVSSATGNGARSCLVVGSQVSHPRNAVEGQFHILKSQFRFAPVYVNYGHCTGC